MFILDTLGRRLPHDSDASFREALADGVVLCRLLNALHPGAVPHVEMGASTPTGGVRQSFENVANFLEAARSLTPETFSAADLEEPGERYVSA